MGLLINLFNFYSKMFIRLQCQFRGNLNAPREEDTTLGAPVPNFVFHAEHWLLVPHRH